MPRSSEEAFEIPAGALYDRDRMASYFFRLARILMGKEEARRLKETPSWFDEDRAGRNPRWMPWS